MHAATAASVLILAGVGCAAARDVPEHDALHAPSQGMPRPLQLPRPLEPPRELGCLLEAQSWPTEQLESAEEGQYLLRFRAGGAPFAQVLAGKEVKLALPVALASAGGLLTLDAAGVVIQGNLEAAEMPIYPAAAFVMSGVFVPNNDRRLVWRSAKPGLITVGTEALPRLHAVQGELTAERACTDVALGAVILDDTAIDRAMQARPPPSEVERPWPWLRAGGLLISATAEGEAAAEIEVIEPRDDTLTIQSPRVLAVEHGQTRIALRVFGGTVFGWVPNERLTTSSAMYMDLSHDCLSLTGYLPRHLTGRLVTCRHDVPLVAEVEGERRLVGAIRAGTRIKPARVEAGWAEIAVEAAVATTDGASFWTRESDLEGCPALSVEDDPSRALPY